MNEQQDASELPQASPYDLALEAVQKVRDLPIADGVKELLSWFPTPERQAELRHLDPASRAEFVASALGSDMQWTAATQYLHIVDHTNGLPNFQELGISQAQLAAVYPSMIGAGHKVEDYIDDTVAKLGDNGLSLVAEKLKTAGDAQGFTMLTLRTTSRAGKEESIGVNLHFPNGEDLNGSAGQDYLIEKAPHDLPLLNSVYDSATHTLSLSFRYRLPFTPEK